MEKITRKILYLALIPLLLSGVTIAHAQSNNPGPKIGIKAGLNLSQLYVDQPNAEDEKMKLGLNFGVFGTIPISNFLAVQPEVLYSNVGSKIRYGRSNFENALTIEPGEVRFNLNYIQVSVVLAANVAPLILHAGPYLSYLLSANVKDLKSANLNPTDVVDFDTDDFNRLDYGVLFGVGFDVQG